MKYEHVIGYVASSLWAIQPSKMAEILSVLAFRAAGGEFTAEEIKARIGEPEQPTPSRHGAVAVIPLHGVIAHRIGSMSEASGGTSIERFGRLYKQAVADESVGAIVLDVNSPGGTVAGVQEVASDLLALRAAGSGKRTVAVANALMASAAYWIAAAVADEIIASPSASVGSIGVFTVREDLSKHLEQQGIAVNVIKAGKYKAEDLPFEPLSDEARAHLQARVDEMYAVMTKQIAEGRGVTPADVRNGFGEGRTLGAKDAKAAGMVDKIATLEETIGRLIGRRQGAGMRAESGDETAGIEPSTPVPRDKDADRRRRLELA